MERTRQAAAQADLIVQLRAFDAEPAGVGLGGSAEESLPAGVPVLEVWNKVDLATPAQRAAVLAAAVSTAVLVSARSGEGVQALEQAVLAALGWSAGSEPGFLARARHLDALERTLRYLGAAQGLRAEELLAEELRRAQEALDDILGEFAPDDLLGEIFATFCIGK